MKRLPALSRLPWLSVTDGDAWNPKARARAHDDKGKPRAGVYVVRERASGRVLYVGESSSGRLWKTLLRHFQDPTGKFARHEFAGIRGSWTHAQPGKLEVAILPVGEGQPSMDLQARAIRKYRPLHNRDAGVAVAKKGEKADADLSGPWDAPAAAEEDDYFGQFARNPAPRKPSWPATFKRIREELLRLGWSPPGKDPKDPQAMISPNGRYRVYLVEKAIWSSSGSRAHLDNARRIDEGDARDMTGADVQLAASGYDLGELRQAEAAERARAEAAKEQNALQYDVIPELGEKAFGGMPYVEVRRTEDRGSERWTAILRAAKDGRSLAAAVGTFPLSALRDLRAAVEEAGARKAANKDRAAAWEKRTKAPATSARPAMFPTALDVVRYVDAGPYHAREVDGSPLGDVVRPSETIAPVRDAIAKGWITVRAASARMPRRYVVTSAGSHALGTFAGADDEFDLASVSANDRARQARLERERAAATAARPAPAVKPEGYGAEDAKKRGQLRLFNPGRKPKPIVMPWRASAAKPSGDLVVLGALTELEYLTRSGERAAWRWSLRDAPALAYDRAGRLFVVFGGRKLGAASPAARREYARTHWGIPGRGELRDGRVLVGAASVLGRGTRITYTTRKGTDAALVDYVHEWGEGARGAFEAPWIVRQGERVALAGGTYRVNERGIVG